MGAQGIATLDFGAFPGQSHASIAVTGQAAIVAGSLVEAWLRPVATADHTEDEHMVETLKVVAAAIVAGTGFTIYGFNTSQVCEQVPNAHGQGAGSRVAATGGPTLSRSSAHAANKEDTTHKGTRLYGQWTVAWAWN